MFVISHLFPQQVGDDVDAYDRLVAKMNNSQVASYAKVIMINPMNKDYPQIAIQIQLNALKLYFSNKTIFVLFCYSIKATF